MATDATLRMLRKRIDGFYLMERIGRGGVSDVFLGIHPKSMERRAFRVLRRGSGMSPSVYAAFTREVDTVRGLSHPGILRIFGCGIVDEHCYYSMEYMPGGNLKRRLSGRPIPADAAVALFLPVCEAMAYAHESGVVHRTLKPSNVLFTARLEPVVSDFGIAPALYCASPLAEPSGEILRDIAYLAPEQRLHPGPVSRRADVYALGAMFYEMCMGFPPLGNYPRPAGVLPGFPEPLERALDRCLAADAQERYGHAGELSAVMRDCFRKPAAVPAAASPAPAKKTFAIGGDMPMPAPSADRIEAWFRVLRTGSARQRLAVVREMVEKIMPSEAKAILKLYPEEGDRVRWGLIRVLGELKIEAATPLILNDLRSSYHSECVIEALGRIGSDDAYKVLREYMAEHPESAAIALLPLAKTGKQRAVRYIQRYLRQTAPAVRRAAIEALAAVRSRESMLALKEHLCVEADAAVRSDLLHAVHTLEIVLLPDSGVRPQSESIPSVGAV